VAFLRIIRDKRGYEYFSLIQATTGRRGKVRQRILYWYRTPPNIKVGRPPLDTEAMRALEAQNPDLQFDWDALHETPPPLPSAEPWRERRLAERAARQLRDAEEELEAAGQDPEPAPAPAVAPPGAPEPIEPEPLEEPAALDVDTTYAALILSGATAASAESAPDVTAPASGRRRRRRRRGRGGRPDGRPAANDAAPLPTENVPSSSTGVDHPEPTDDED
jgi:hypothetical protein